MIDPERRGGGEKKFNHILDLTLGLKVYRVGKDEG